MKGQVPDPFLRRWLLACGWTLMALAVAVLIGRFTGQAWLVRIVPGGAPMAFPTVLAFFGAGFVFHSFGLGQPARGRAGALALLLFTIGTLVVYFLAAPLGWPEFGYNAVRPLAHGAGFDGRMSPVTTGAFAVLALALMLADRTRPRFVWIIALATVLLTVSLLAFVSYVTGLRALGTWWHYMAMAVHTSGGLVLAAATLLIWVVHEMRMLRRPTARTAPFFAAAGTTMFVLGAVLVLMNEQRRETAHAVQAARDLRIGVERFISAVARMETSTRNFIITGESRYEERFQTHRSEVLTAVAELDALSAGNVQRLSLVAALRPLVERKFASNDAQLRARREQGFDAARQTLLDEPAEILLGLHATTDALDADVARQLGQLQDDAGAGESAVRMVLRVGMLLAVSLIALAFMLVNRAYHDLQRANDQLEERVRLRTAELEAGAKELRASEGRLRFLADTMPQLVWTARADGTIETVNQGYRDYLGCASDAEAIARMDTVVHPDDQRDSRREWTAMRSEGRSAGGELRLRRFDGVYRWHLWRAHPERDAAGNILRWVGTSTDIHHQKLAEEELERRVMQRATELAASEERFRQAFDFAGIGMAIVALDGRWVRANKSLCEIIGYSERELVEKTFQDITHPDDLAADLAHVQELLEGTLRFYQMEKRYFHRSGHIVWVQLTVSLVRDQADRPVHFVSQVEDITEKKRLEENLARARDQALEASRLKSEFLATMSHEIRTPMNGVIGMTALLRDTPLSPLQADYVRTIESSGDSLLTILNDILDYSKIEAGRIELEITPFDLRQCIADALDLFAGRASEKNLKLASVIPREVPERVAGDATRLRQILVNLLGNAVKFTERGDVTVSVRSEAPESGGRQRLHFAVRDTGIGIPLEGMDRLFKSFSQVDASTTRRFGGTGLGLVISKRLAELMGGTVWAESVAGVGSTFHFTALVEPLAETPKESEPAAVLASSDPRLAQRFPLRLLVAEDNPVNQRVATLLLQRLGYRATVVGNGLEALAALEMADYDAVLMDVEMPELDGCEATRRIRAARPSGTRPWIIALTAGAMQGDRERALAAGMNDYLTKPVRTEALSAALMRAHAGVSRGSTESGAPA